MTLSAVSWPDVIFVVPPTFLKGIVFSFYSNNLAFTQTALHHSLLESSQTPLRMPCQLQLVLAAEVSTVEVEMYLCIL